MKMLSARGAARLVLVLMMTPACRDGGKSDDGDDSSTTDTTTSTSSTTIGTTMSTTASTTLTTTATVTSVTTTGPIGEPCCTPLGVPSCAEDPEIAECVCESDRYCCEVIWDDVCVERVTSLGCGICDPGTDVTTGTPPDNVGSCCSPHPETGCEIESVSACVCDGEPSCCDDGWHEGCVEAVGFFGCGVCPVDPSTSTDTGVPPDNTEGCCFSHDSTGCEYPAIAECVCGSLPGCCDDEWSESCVDAIGELGCGICPP